MNKKELKKHAEIVARYITLQTIEEELQEAQYLKKINKGYETIDECIYVLKEATKLL